jgi:hypothetical protein
VENTEITMTTSKKWSIALLALAAGLLTTGSAFAWGHRSHVFVGLNFGFPAYYPAPYYYYPPAPVYYPAPVVIQSPPVYTERQDMAPADTQAYWYYCASSKGYYPYVKECPGGWQKVAPTPPG